MFASRTAILGGRSWSICLPASRPSCSAAFGCSADRGRGYARKQSYACCTGKDTHSRERECPSYGTLWDDCRVRSGGKGYRHIGFVGPSDGMACDDAVRVYRWICGYRCKKDGGDGGSEQLSYTTRLPYVPPCAQRSARHGTSSAFLLRETDARRPTRLRDRRPRGARSGNGHADGTAGQPRTRPRWGLSAAAQ